MREIRTLRAMRRGLETGLRLGYCGTPRGNGEQQIGLTFGTPRQSSTLPGFSPALVHPAPLVFPALPGTVNRPNQFVLIEWRR